MSDCLFCKIADGKIPAKIIAQNDHALAFRDLNPQAPTHVLIIPRKHIATLNDLTDGDAELVGRLHLLARQVAADEQLNDGWRTVFNVGAHAGQTVFHIHLHLLGGRTLGWPPG
ncbi:MAG: histidine triad nucleotide-binding protein [Myxococcales bacterium]|nr:histidine triad nucleotide-binding protein [Myxococcales bacterium]